MLAVTQTHQTGQSRARPKEGSRWNAREPPSATTLPLLFTLFLWVLWHSLVLSHHVLHLMLIYACSIPSDPSSPRSRCAHSHMCTHTRDHNYGEEGTILQCWLQTNGGKGLTNSLTLHNDFSERDENILISTFKKKEYRIVTDNNTTEFSYCQT